MRVSTIAMLLHLFGGFGAMIHAAMVTLPRIEEISTQSLFSQPYNPNVSGEPFVFFLESRERVVLSDGTVGGFGAGGSQGSTSEFLQVRTTGGRLEYTFAPIADSVFFARTSYSDVRTEFILGFSKPIVLFADVGSNVATFSGQLEVLSSGFSAPFEGSESALLGAKVGDLVPVTMTYTRLNGPWSASSFDSPFSYQFSGKIVTVPEPGRVLYLTLGICLFLRRNRASSPGPCPDFKTAEDRTMRAS